MSSLENDIKALEEKLLRKYSEHISHFHGESNGILSKIIYDLDLSIKENKAFKGVNGELGESILKLKKSKKEHRETIKFLLKIIDKLARFHYDVPLGLDPTFYVTGSAD